ncbi:MAG: cation transporter [Propionibacteriaceae bacterium]|nr:cation transporter [Propionibacteriaceae bacterium]
MRTTYIITGMTCGNCAKHITEELQEIDGVTAAQVDWESGRAIIESENHIPYDAVIAAVAEAGNYTVVEA